MLTHARSLVRRCQTTLQSQIRRELLANQGVATGDRTIALLVARSLQSQLFFYEVEWGGRVLQDGVEDVYMFLDDQEGGAGSAGGSGNGSGNGGGNDGQYEGEGDGGGEGRGVERLMAESAVEREELPTSVITVLTKCYSPSCVEGAVCYSFACPRRPRVRVSLSCFLPAARVADALCRRISWRRSRRCPRSRGRRCVRAHLSSCLSWPARGDLTFVFACRATGSGTRTPTCSSRSRRARSTAKSAPSFSLSPACVRRRAAC